MTDKLFRNQKGEIKEIFNDMEGINFIDNPLDVYIMLSRYKFAARIIRKTDTVLDIACGQGYGTVFLSHYCQQVVGVDKDRELIAYCNRMFPRDNLTFKEGDFLNLRVIDIPRPDVLVSMDTIEHFSQKEGDEIVSQIASLLNDSGGMAIIGTPNAATESFASGARKKAHVYEYRFEEFDALMNRHFSRSFVLSMSDETVNTAFPQMAWFFIGIGIQ
jgi:2-polyprenyl-3-methyl-5-hydroxy-6-metoxy-1,4-benzoquinol methylase